MRDITPADTSTSSQVDESNFVPNSSTHATPRAKSPETPSLRDLTQEIEEDDTEMQDIHLVEEDHETVRSTNLNDYHPLLRFFISNNSSNHWSRHATIRHSNVVLFSFRHFAIPEDGEALGVCLNSFRMAGGITHAAKCLSELLEEKNVVTITMNGVYQLENLWARTSHQPVSENDCPIRARILFHTYLRSKDWQVVRELSCVTGSRRAIEELVIKAGNTWSWPSNDWTVHRCPCLITDTQSLRSLCGKESTTSAALNLSLHLEPLVHDNAEAHFRWATQSNTEADEARFDPWAALNLKSSSHRSISGLRYRSILEELLPGRSAPPFLVPLLRIPTRLGVNGAILLKKPPSWSAICPTFCLMVFDESSFDDEPGLSQKITRVFNAGDIYVVQLDGSRGNVISESDESAIGVWTDILSGKKAADAHWPS